MLWFLSYFLSGSVMNNPFVACLDPSRLFPKLGNFCSKRGGGNCTQIFLKNYLGKVN